MTRNSSVGPHGFRPSDPFWEALFLDSGCRVVLLDGDLNVVAANPSACRFLGGGTDALLGRSYRELLQGRGFHDRLPDLEAVLMSGEKTVVRFEDEGRVLEASYRRVLDPELRGGCGVLVSCRDHVTFG